jgi:hypothetical protein
MKENEGQYLYECNKIEKEEKYFYSEVEDA